MERMTNQTAYQILGAMANGMTGAQLPAAAEEKDMGKFQELMDKAKSGQTDSTAEEQPKTQKPTAARTKKEAPAQKLEEDPVETAKKAQVVVVGQLEPDVVLEPVTLEAPETGEDITIAAGDWEPQIWVHQSTPEEIVDEPHSAGGDVRAVDVSNPNSNPEREPEPNIDPDPAPAAGDVLEAVVPGVDNSPAVAPEQVTVKRFGREVQRAEEKVEPQAEPQDKAQDKARVETWDEPQVKPQDKPQDKPQIERQVQQEETGEVRVEYGEAKPEPMFHDVKAVPIKVGDAARVRETEETPEVGRQVDDRLTQALRQGETRVELQLTPERLGAVKVEITRTVEGTVHVSLSAQNGQTRTLLEKHASDLQNTLGARTQDQVRVEVNKQEESQRRDQNPYEGHNGQGQRQQQEHRRRQQTHSGEDFLQQLRLGLIPVEE